MSVCLVEEVDELLEVDLVVRLDAGYFDHRVHLLVGYALPQDLEHLLQILCAYVSFPAQSRVVRGRRQRPGQGRAAAKEGTYFCRSNIENARMR